MAQSIPRDVVEADHRLDSAAERTTEELAHHRWHHIGDPDGPQYTVGAYAKAVDRSDSTIRRHVLGYAAWVENPKLSLEDHFRMVQLSAENQSFAQAIADEEGVPVARVARGDNRRRLLELKVQAQDRALLRGTDPIEEVRHIVRNEKQAARSSGARERERRERHSIRYIVMEGDIERAKHLLLGVLKEAEGVPFDDEEKELLRDSVENVRAVLTLITMRLDGAVDIDWDLEAAKLAGSAS